MEKKKNQLPYLPFELIIEILLRLLVKSLICFKCVCKSWLTLISDSSFANSKFEVTAATQPHRALFISSNKSGETRYINLEASFKDDTDSVSLNPITFIHYGHSEIIGSCRGFILLLYRSTSTLYLWNPSTRVHKNIPLSPLSINLPFDDFNELFYGFGYDQSTDDYLIVLNSSGTNSLNMEIFSLRANTWKQIDGGTHIHFSNTTRDHRKEGSLFNEAIHWFAYHPDLQNNVILAFDLMERKLFDMYLPDRFDLEIDRNSGLWVFQEFLSLWTIDHDNDRVEIWVMKEYRVHSSWTKTHVLPTDVNVIPPNNLSPSSNYFSPLCSTKSSDIVGKNGYSRLVKYNEAGTVLELHSYLKDPRQFQVVMYTESLLSLPGDNVQAYEDGTNKKKTEVVKFIIG